MEAATPLPREPRVSALPGMLGPISVSHSSMPEPTGDSGKAAVASLVPRGGLRQPRPLGSRGFLRLRETSAPCPACRGLHTLLSDKASQYHLHEPLVVLLEGWRDVALWSNGSFWNVLHVSCMVWGIRGAAFPLACREDVCLFLVLPSRGCSGLGRAELRDSHDTAGTLPTLVQSVCPPHWILLCPGDPFFPPSLSICSLSLASPCTRCGHSFPMGMGLGAEGTGPAARLAGGGSFLLIPCTHVQSGAEPEHPSGTCFPSSLKSVFLEHQCLSVLILPPQHPQSLCLHELFLY